MERADQIRIATEAALRWVQLAADWSHRQVDAIGAGDELGERRGRQEQAQALQWGRELADYVADRRERGV